MLPFINWPNLIIWLPLLLEILGNKCITIVCFPGFDVKYFEINLSNPAVFLHYWKTKTKNEYLEKEMSFKGETKNIFHQF